MGHPVRPPPGAQGGRELLCQKSLIQGRNAGHSQHQMSLQGRLSKGEDRSQLQFSARSQIRCGHVLSEQDESILAS